MEWSSLGELPAAVSVVILIRHLPSTSRIGLFKGYSRGLGIPQPPQPRKPTRLANSADGLRDGLPHGEVIHMQRRCDRSQLSNTVMAFKKVSLLPAQEMGD